LSPNRCDNDWPNLLPVVTTQPHQQPRIA